MKFNFSTVARWQDYARLVMESEALNASGHKDDGETALKFEVYLCELEEEPNP